MCASQLFFSILHGRTFQTNNCCIVIQMFNPHSASSFLFNSFSTNILNVISIYREILMRRSYIQFSYRSGLGSVLYCLIIRLRHLARYLDYFIANIVFIFVFTFKLIFLIIRFDVFFFCSTKRKGV